MCEPIGCGGIGDCVVGVFVWFEVVVSGLFMGWD